MLVIGLGAVGLPTASYLGDFFEVYGYDIKQIIGKNFTTVRSLNETSPDVYVVCVPTKQVYVVCKAIAKSARAVIIESTMKVGECRRIANAFGIEQLAHCPHRYWAESPKLHGVNQTRVLGALNEESLRFARRFYSKAHIKVRLVSSLEVAEASKLIENANRFVNIAFVEECKMLCDKLAIDFEEVRKACNTKWNIQLLEARNGIKGKCLPQDIRFLLDLNPRMALMRGALKTDEKYKRG